MFVILRNLIFLCLLQIIYSQSILENEKDKCKDSSYRGLCVKLGKKSYLVEAGSKLNWYDAERFCRRQNAFLATIENAEEARNISNYLISQGYDKSDKYFWLSGNDLGSEGSFYSIKTGDLLPYTNWTPGQPDNAGGNENCAHLWKRRSQGYEMNDSKCDNKMNFICELGDSKNNTKAQYSYFLIREDCLKQIKQKSQ